MRCSRWSRRAWCASTRSATPSWRRFASSPHERLDEAGELDEARRRHFDFYLALAEAEDTSAEAGYGTRSNVLLRDQENLRAAVEWAVAEGDRVGATELMVLLENFWVATDPFEGARRFDELLTAPGELPTRLRARALRCYAGSLWLSGEYERSHRMNEQSLALFRELEDDEGIAVLLHRLGISTLSFLKDPVKARELFERGSRAIPPGRVGPRRERGARRPGLRVVG